MMHLPSPPAPMITPSKIRRRRALNTLSPLPPPQLSIALMLH